MVDQSLYRDVNGNLVSRLILNKIGDSAIIKTNHVIIGLVNITGVVVRGEVSTLKIEMRYSVDSIFWSDWVSIENIDLSTIDLKERHPFKVEYQLTNLSNTVNYVDSIELQITKKKLEIPSTYNQLPFSNFFPFYNLKALLWGTNVLPKFFKRGIVSKFLERDQNKEWEDEDYINFWWFSIYFEALQVCYNEVFSEVLFRKDLLEDFLKNRDLTISRNRDLGELYYLATNYYNEMRRRGTSPMLKEESLSLENFHNIKVEGELLRLLETPFKELEIFSLDKDMTGWYINSTSPFFYSSLESKSLIKGWEVTQDVESLDNYPLLSSGEGISIVEDSLSTSTINCIQVQASNFRRGIGYSGEVEKIIPINPHFSYEITFLVKYKTLVSKNVRLSIELEAFDTYNNKMTNALVSSIDNNSKSIFISSSEWRSKYKDKNIREYMLVSCIVYPSNVSSNLSQQPNLRIGRNLKFASDNIRGIVPRISIVGEIGDVVNIYDLKIRPSIVEGVNFLSQDNLLLIRYFDKPSLEKLEKLKDTLEEKLIPYDTELILQKTDI